MSEELKSQLNVALSAMIHLGFRGCSNDNQTFLVKTSSLGIYEVFGGVWTDRGGDTIGAKFYCIVGGQKLELPEFHIENN
jgi:hypothetical protein